MILLFVRASHITDVYVASFSFPRPSLINAESEILNSSVLLEFES